MKEWGVRGVCAFAGACVAASLLFFLIILPKAGVDTTPLSSDKTVQVLPSTGVESFDVEHFVCDDPNTKVKGPLPNPDGADSYQLTRVDSQGITELVVINFFESNRQITYARHFYDTHVGPDGENAYASPKAQDCILRKATLK